MMNLGKWLKTSYGLENNFIGEDGKEYTLCLISDRLKLYKRGLNENGFKVYIDKTHLLTPQTKQSILDELDKITPESN
jgi:hypothetical protein